ncbi:ribulose-bisphosphate carboxylase large subunit family protein [Paraburkholderia rhynchosiae]|uniref:3-oxo-isoapionate-4-phosphate transcarboxylase/hydrolase n=1 Tax=Paraburkholderia rhynchosiae TaxID=487049 RepID=A0A2N7WN90_9BURK|nr:ribulose-bisphosphate carboxylase large subunit family protein [Paraburkholderia rhynchosiae]PMS30927.1 ribulose 1,5-bisphosphate carboxylase [Paraburkholderia rhynchosiae]CAB3733051.1 3-oxo-isoapionate-4-phosphate transcarboxylase/hydrolase [Paraburkholderia rhynchosiae]
MSETPQRHGADHNSLEADYLIETPLDPARVAEIMAGEQSSGTFVRVANETDALRARSRASVVRIDELDAAAKPSLPSAWLARQDVRGPWRRARVTLSFPLANIDTNLPTLAATVAGNLYDLGEVTGMRLLSLRLPASYRARFEAPRHGVKGTRTLTQVTDGPMIGTIIKPNVGLSAAETAALVRDLCEAGVDFIKDDEVSANPVHAPLAERVRAVMSEIRRYRERSGRHVMVAFNITDDLDAMRRHAELVEREGGSCVMASINWCGFSAIQTLRRATPLVLHAHRNGYGMMSRDPALGISFQAYQTLWRLTGVDHMHVHGLAGKFAQSDEEVIDSARDCATPLAPGCDDAVLPAFSSGQWAGTAQATFDALQSTDLLFMSGGGILAHPDGPAAGVTSVRQAWAAVQAGTPLSAYAEHMPELRRALEFFGGRT